jgi:ATP-dependent DNA helicase DinG
VLAEAGTGVGKTLGYLAPASLWAEKNHGTVWISTYTRNLQTQIAGELDRLYPDPVQKRRRVVIRKGRENFLCLLNYEDAVRATTARAQPSAPLALIARWIASRPKRRRPRRRRFSRLALRADRRAHRVAALADRRGECVYSACQHFRKCFVEKNVRAARHARLVVANHALVMAQAALGGLDDGTVPTRYVFDEGHHLLEAADSAFSVRLSGARGASCAAGSSAPRRRARARGLQRRIGDLIDGRRGGGCWSRRWWPRAPARRRLAPAPRRGRPGCRLRKFPRAGAPTGAGARASGPDSVYGLEAEARPPVDGLVEAAARGWRRRAGSPATAPMRLAALLRKQLETRRTRPDPTTRQRLDAAIRGLERRADMQLGAWSQRCCAMAREPPRPRVVDWLALDRFEGNETSMSAQPQLGRSRHALCPGTSRSRRTASS